MIVVCLLLFLFPCSTSWSSPELTVAESEHDYGVIYQGEKETIDHFFQIQNTGDERLDILKVESSCGCTLAEVSVPQLQPGENAEVHAQFRTHGKSGLQQIRITLITNDFSAPSKDLFLKGYILDPFRLVNPILDAGVLVHPSTREVLLEIYAQSRLHDPTPELQQVLLDNPRVRLSGMIQKHRQVAGRFRESVFAQKLIISSMTGECGFDTNPFRVEMGGVQTTTLHGSVTWFDEQDLIVRPQTLNLFRSKYYEGPPEDFRKRSSYGEIQILSRSGTPFEITSVDPPSHFNGTWEQLQPTQATIKITLTEAPPGPVEGMMYVHTTSVTDPTLNILLKAVVEEQVPVWTIPRVNHSFGLLFANSVKDLSHTFEFSNMGNRNLELSLENLTGLEASLANEILTPGQSSSLTLMPNPKPPVGNFTYQARLKSNDPAAPERIFTITGQILADWEFIPPVLHLGTLQEGRPEQRQFRIRQRFLPWEQPQPFSLLVEPATGIKLIQGSMTTRFDQSDYGEAETPITIELTPTLPGLHQAQIHLLPQNQPVPQANLKLDWRVSGDLSLKPSSLVFRKNAEKIEKKNCSVISQSGKVFSLKRVETPDWLNITLQDDPSPTRFTVEPVAPPSGESRQTIRIYTDQPQESPLEMDIFIR